MLYRFKLTILDYIILIYIIYFHLGIRLYIKLYFVPVYDANFLFRVIYIHYVRIKVKSVKYYVYLWTNGFQSAGH